MPSRTPSHHEPGAHLGGGVFQFWIQSAVEVASSAGLGWRIFLRDFSARYRQQAMGILWAFLGPALTVLPFILLVDAKILDLGELAVPYPVYSLTGAVLWGLVQGLIISCSVVISNAGTLVTKIHFPREALLYSPVLIALFDFGVKIIILAAVFVAFGVPLRPSAVFHLIAVLPAVALALGIGMVAAIFGAVFKDTQQILTHIFQALMFATPVLYPALPGTTLARITKWNPFFYLVSVPRDSLISGRFPDGVGTGYALCCLVAVAVFLCGLRFYRIAILRVTERV